MASGFTGTICFQTNLDVVGLIHPIISPRRRHALCGQVRASDGAPCMFLLRQGSINRLDRLKGQFETFQHSEFQYVSRGFIYSRAFRSAERECAARGLGVVVSSCGPSRCETQRARRFANFIVTMIKSCPPAMALVATLVCFFSLAGAVHWKWRERTVPCGMTPGQKCFRPPKSARPGASYWQTSISYNDCQSCDDEECHNHYFLFWPKLNSYVIHFWKKDVHGGGNFMMCIVEGRSPREKWPARFCTKFSSSFRQQIAQEAAERCKASLCRLAKSGDWKPSWVGPVEDVDKWITNGKNEWRIWEMYS